jgi:ribosomal protein S12 methylthiotransferase accessory factor
MLFSDRQFQNRTLWNEKFSRFNWVPEQFDEDREIDWSPVWSLTHNNFRYVPTAYCYYGYSRQKRAWFTRADANGCAAGNSPAEAILQGFMELVERDSVALWWYNRLKRPGVELAGFDEPYFQKLLAHYQTLNRDLWVLDISSDLNIPAFAAISRRNDKPVEDIMFGFGAHFDPKVAILRALTELNQMIPWTGLTPKNRPELGEAMAWWSTATVANQPYLTPDKNLPPKIQADYPKLWSDDLYTDVLNCVQIVQAKGLETLVLDQTRPDTGLHVVKVIVPGLRHFWARFGPGRLYDVPVQMGWLTEPLTEEQLNSNPMFL